MGSVKLYAVTDAGTYKPKAREVVEIEAEQRKTMYVITHNYPYDTSSAFQHRSRIYEAERESMCIGLTPLEAIDLTFNKWVAKKEAAMEQVDRAKAALTELMHLAKAQEAE